MNRIRTDILEIAFEEGGPPNGIPVLLLHGWPDAPRGWNEVSRRLQADGFRTIAPYLRGSSPTEFLLKETPRVGAGVALAQDALDFADALGLENFAVLGHDWGAREAYILAALFPERVLAIAALALAYQPRGTFSVPSFDQSRRFWYQWLMCTGGGAAAVRKDPVGFARIQWETWSPAGWFDEEEFTRTAESFSNPDWVAITLNAYRARWREGEAWDSRYDALQNRLREVEYLRTPTLMIQGLSVIVTLLTNQRDSKLSSPVVIAASCWRMWVTSPIGRHRDWSPMPFSIIFSKAFSPKSEATFPEELSISLPSQSHSARNERTLLSAQSNKLECLGVTQWNLSP